MRIRHCLFWTLLIGCTLLTTNCNSDQATQVLTTTTDGTALMYDTIQSLIQRLDFIAHPYESKRQAAAIAPQYQVMIQAGKISPELNIRYGMVLLKAGETNQAIDIFESVIQQLPENAVVNEVTKQFHELRALAFLRKGEQDNCIANHTPVSCLFPIQPEAVHTLTEGSERAIAIYESILSVFPEDLRSRWLLNLAYMTLGRYPQDVPAPWLIPPHHFTPEAELPAFANVATNVGLDINELAGGSITDDFNNDGLLDLIASSWNLDGNVRYFENQGEQGFVERTAVAGLTQAVGGLNMIQADYDNDGHLDFYVLRGAWSSQKSWGQLPNSLIRNNGDGTFSDVTVAAGLYGEHPSQAAVWLDYDSDGLLDLFVSHETSKRTEPHPCQLFHNLGDGTFKDVAPEMGLNVIAFVKGVAAADYNNDGRPDLYLSIINGPNQLFRNDGGSDPATWTFTELAATARVTQPKESFPTWFFDYNNDGLEDIFVAAFDFYLLKEQSHEMAADYLGQPLRSSYSRLYLNDGLGGFVDQTTTAGLDHALPAMGCNYGDLDNDGFPDFYLGTGAPDFRDVVPNRMFKNNGQGQFDDVTYAGGFGHIQKGHGISFADLDNDGDQDVYAVMGGSVSGDHFQNALFENPGNGNDWLTLRLHGTHSNRSAIGAKIRLTVHSTGQDPRLVFHTVGSGGSFGANSLQAEIGLGSNVQKVDIAVDWPDGQAGFVDYPTTPPNSILQLTEGQPKWKKLPQQTIQFPAASAHGHEHHHGH